MKKLTLISVIILMSNLLCAQYNKIDTSFYSEALGEEKMVDIYFPPGYNDNPELFYPVIYYLHGWNGSQNSMSGMLSTATSLINNGTIDPVIIVGADNSPDPFGGNMYVNSELWGNYEDYMIIDLISWIESSFRAMPARKYRALLGQSMGSHGAFRYGILHKDIFAALAGHAGILTFDKDLWLEDCRQQVIIENQSSPPFFYDYNTDGLFTRGALLISGAFSPDTNSTQTYINPQVVNYFIDENADYNDSVLLEWQPFEIMELVKQLSVYDSVGIFFGCGTEDDFLLYPGNMAMNDTLNALGLPHVFYSHTGSHSMPYGFKSEALIFLDSLIMPPTPVTRIDQSVEQNNTYNLMNYPNPFSKVTTIQFRLSKDSFIELDIWNHFGQKVETLFTGYKKYGQHKTLFNSSQLPSGIYFCRLRVDSKIITKKIIKFE